MSSFSADGIQQAIPVSQATQPRNRRTLIQRMLRRPALPPETPEATIVSIAVPETSTFAVSALEQQMLEQALPESSNMSSTSLPNRAAEVPIPSAPPLPQDWEDEMALREIELQMTYLPPHTINIQRVVRGWLGRVRAIKEKEKVLTKRRDSAKKIQPLVRGFLARVKTKARAEEKASLAASSPPPQEQKATAMLDDVMQRLDSLAQKIDEKIEKADDIISTYNKLEVANEETQRKIKAFTDKIEKTMTKG